jgi:hypothetical protein
MVKITDVDKIQREDHDLLVRIEANLTNLGTDVKIMGDGINLRVSDHEIRIQKLETVGVQTDPVETIRQFHILQQQVHDFMTTANVLRIAAGIIGGLVFYLLTQIPFLLHAWGIIIR